MLDNKLQTFSTWFYFNNFVDEMFVNVYGRFCKAACEQLETTFLPSEMFISNNVCMADFLHCFHWMIPLWNLMLQHGARQHKRAQCIATVQWQLAKTSYFACFVCCVKRGVRARPTPRKCLSLRPARFGFLSASPSTLDPRRVGSTCARETRLVVVAWIFAW